MKQDNSYDYDKTFLAKMAKKHPEVLFENYVFLVVGILDEHPDASEEELEKLVEEKLERTYC
jgi:hypothetical protein